MGWWNRAKPGDKVVFIGSCSREIEHYLGLVRGGVYTVQRIEPDNCTNGFVVVWDNNPESPTDVGCFRPVQTKSTEASMNALRKHLTGKTAEVA